MYYMLNELSVPEAITSVACICWLDFLEDRHEVEGYTWISTDELSTWGLIVVLSPFLCFPNKIGMERGKGLGRGGMNRKEQNPFSCLSPPVC